MDKKFNDFCAKLKRQRQATSQVDPYSPDVRCEALEWAEKLSIQKVAQASGISKASLQNWKRAHVDKTMAVPEQSGEPAIHVTRVSLAALDARPVPLARLVKGPLSIEVFDKGLLLEIWNTGGLP